MLILKLKNKVIYEIQCLKLSMISFQMAIYDQMLVKQKCFLDVTNKLKVQKRLVNLILDLVSQTHFDSKKVYGYT